MVSKINGGMNVAYVSDAGTPGISDPGYILVNRAIENRIKVVPVSGIAAVIAALSVSGLPMDSFVFNGFLPSRANKRRLFLESLKDESRTMLFYESPNRLVSTLRDIEKIMGNREVVVSRELTKVFEEILRGDVRKIMDSLRERVVKGEITLVVAGKEKTPRQFASLHSSTPSLPSCSETCSRLAPPTKTPSFMYCRTK